MVEENNQQNDIIKTEVVISHFFRIYGYYLRFVNFKSNILNPSSIRGNCSISNSIDMMS